MEVKALKLQLLDKQLEIKSYYKSENAGQKSFNIT